MDQSDLQRMKEDLAAISQAVGLEPCARPEAVWLNWAVAAGGLVTLLWALLPHGLPEQWGAIPLILLIVGSLARKRLRYRRGTGRSPLHRRVYSAEIMGALLVAALALVYRLWATELGISLRVAGSAAIFIMGVTLLLPPLRDRSRLPDAGYALPLILCGLTMPFVPTSPWVPLGATFAVGGAAAAVLAAFRARATGYAAD